MINNVTLHQPDNVIPGDDGDDSEAEEDAGPSDEDHEPEPEEDIDLLVNDIQRQDAQTQNKDQRK